MILKRLALSSLIMIGAANLHAQTFTVGSATVAPGGTANITVTFASGATAAASAQVDLTFLRPPGIASGSAVATVGSVTGAGAPTCAGNAVSTLTGTLIRTIVATNASPAAGVGVPAGQVACTFAIPISGTAAAGNFPFTISLQEFTNPAGVKFAGNVVNGSITVQPAGPTSNVTQSPAALAFGASIIGTATATQNLVLANTNATAGSATCTISGVNAADFAFFPAVAGGVVAIASGATVNVPVRFTPSGAGARGASIACGGTTAATVVTGSPTALTGTGNPPADLAPVLTYTPAPGAISFPAGLAGVVNAAIGISTGTPGTGAGTTTVSGCAFSAGFTPAGTASTTPVNGIFSVTVTSGTINLSCTRGAVAQTATLTCTETRSPTVVGSPFTRSWPTTCPQAQAPATVVTASSPSGTNIVASNQIGSAATVATPSITFINTVAGSAPGSVTCSIAGPANGWTVLPVGPISVVNPTPTPNPAVFTFSFAATAAGAQNAVATCSGTGLAAPLTYNLNGTGTAVPALVLVTQVPTLSTLSIWLLVASMLGFGLVMVGRRQS